MRNIKAVIFDLDDTLYPEVEYVKSGFKHVSNIIYSMIHVDKDYVYEQFWNLFSEDKNNVFNRFLQLHDIQNSSMEKCMIYEYRRHLPAITLTSEHIEILEWLVNMGYMIGIITDGRPEGQRNKIKALNLEKYCNNVIVTDELGGIEFRKPNKTAFLNMLTYLKIKSEEAIYIGDNPKKDFISCNKLGINTIMLVTNTGVHSQEILDNAYRANISINNLLDLKTLLEGWS